MGDDDKVEHYLRTTVFGSAMIVRAGRKFDDDDGQMRKASRRVSVPVNSDQWHKLRVEFHKQDIVVHVDGTPQFRAAARGEVDQDVEKNRVGFRVRGTVELSKLKVWTATPNSDWPKARRSIPWQGKMKEGVEVLSAD